MKNEKLKEKAIVYQEQSSRYMVAFCLHKSKRKQPTRLRLVVKPAKRGFTARIDECNKIEEELFYFMDGQRQWGNAEANVYADEVRMYRAKL